MIAGQADTPLCELGWKSLGVLELTALPSLDEERWLAWVQETDALLVGGGDALYRATGCVNPGSPTFCLRLRRSTSE